MEITVTPEEMRQIERQWLEETKIPSIVLMEEAARGVVQRLGALCPEGSRVLFLCGPGNNGGDGYAAARFWRQRGGRALLIELQPAAAGDAAHERDLALLSGAEVVPWREGDPLPEASAAVDALFGTGMNRPLEGKALALVRQLNRSGLPVLAVDIPSGLSGLSGQVLGDCVRAKVTVTFHRLKQGLLLRDGPRYTGEVAVHPVLIPEDYGGAEGLRCLTPEELPALLPGRDPLCHKGDYGRVLIFAGSMGMAGAACMCARAAVRAGAGLTTVLCRAAVAPVLQALVPAAMCIPLPEEGGCLTAPAAEAAKAALARADSAVVGCGLGLSDDLLPLLDVFRSEQIPVVWDADALTLLSRHEALLPLPAGHVITPHPGEAARLLRRSAGDILSAPLEALEALRRRTGACVLLKGARTLMVEKDRRAVNRFTSPALAKGGSGDVLAGILGALLGRRDLKLTTLERMQCAALAHGLAARKAAALSGEDGMTPEELIACLRVR